MTTDLMLRRKWTLRAHGRQVVFVKKSNESSEHVLMKALLWALYLPDYPELTVEISIGDRYKPDVVALDAQGSPTFWAEAGQVGVDKIQSLVRRHRRTHFALNGQARAERLFKLTRACGAKRHLPRKFELADVRHHGGLNAVAHRYLDIALVILQLVELDGGFALAPHVDKRHLSADSHDGALYGLAIPEALGFGGRLEQRGKIFLSLAHNTLLSYAISHGHDVFV